MCWEKKTKLQISSCQLLVVKLNWKCLLWKTKFFIEALTYLPLYKMAAISQMIFSSAFSWMKTFVFWLKFPWSLFLGVQMTITQCWLLSEPMLNWFTDKYMRHHGEMSWWIKPPAIHRCFIVKQKMIFTTKVPSFIICFFSQHPHPCMIPGKVWPSQHPSCLDKTKGWWHTPTWLHHPVGGYFDAYGFCIQNPSKQ